LGLQWWIKRIIVTADCPICDTTFNASRASQFQCPNCGEPLQEQQNKFVRLTPPGTIDVDVQVVE
jgi:tRNA(Ile2) C34 agmatinyltransferase TiaS